MNGHTPPPCAARKRVRPTSVLLGIAAVASLLAPAAARADDRFQWDIVLDTAVSPDRVGRIDLGSGGGFDLSAALRLTDNFGVYGGWGWHRFSSGYYDSRYDDWNADDIRTETSSFAIGAQLQTRPFDQVGIGYRLRAGATWNNVRLEDVAARELYDYRWQNGFEIEAAAVARYAHDWRMVYRIGYRSVARDLWLPARGAVADLEYVHFGIGFAHWF